MVHVKYPSMERQDLTQAQLGSFKFTPVDEVRPDAAMFPPHPRLAKQYVTSLKTAELIDQRFRRPDTASSSAPSFYDYDSKSSLDNSRSRLRPIAVRQALASDNISAHACAPDISLASYVQPYDARLLRLSDDSGYESNYTPEYSGSSETYSSHSLNQSLIIALQSEQDAHNVTKMSLETESARRIESDLEHQKLVEHNKNLLNSIRLLQSTVKHMVQKQGEGGDTSQRNEPLRKDTMGHPSVAGVEHQTVLPDPELGNKAEVAHRVDRAQSLQRLDDCTENNFENLATFAPSSHELSQVDDFISTNVATTVNGIQKTTRLFELPLNFRAKYGTPARHHDKTALEVSDSEVIAEAQSDTMYSTVNPRISLSDPQHIDWKMTSLELEKMRSECLGAGTVQCRTPFSHFKRQPIRYMPEITGRNIFRTCMIDFIPYIEAIKYSEVLRHIRGGGLQSITMYGPIGAMTDFVTARVIFTHESSATAFYERGQNPGLKILGQPVRVWQVMEPTYPPNEELEQQIYEQDYTRLLVIDFNNDKLEATLQNKLAGFISQALVIDIRATTDGATLVEFTSIDDSARALRILMADPDFSGVQFDFEEDYCARKYDDTTESVHSIDAV